MTPAYRSWWGRCAGLLTAFVFVTGLPIGRTAGLHWYEYLFLVVVTGADLWLLGLALPALILRLRREK